ncbi:MAG: DUF3267 domain-containing protein [Paenisporosarcina sp.]
MNTTNQPTEIIELNLQRIAWQSFVGTAILSIFIFLLNAALHKEFNIDLSLTNLIVFMVGYILLIVLHELSHLIGFVLFGKVPWSSLNYGVNLKLGIAYATTNELLRNKAMKRVLLLPFWTTGVLPTVIGLWMNHSLLVLLGAFLIAGAIGDFAMYKELRKVSNDAFIKDDPELPKLYVYEDK